MSGYKTTHMGSITFDGQKVGYTLKRLTVSEAMTARGISGPQLDAFLRERLVSLDEIRDADGNPIALDTIFGDFYFSNLCSELAVRLFETGRIPREKVDPSAGSSSAASTDAGSRSA